MIKEQTARHLLEEIQERKTRKTKFSGYNDIYCTGYRMALEDVLEIKRPKCYRSGANKCKNCYRSGANKCKNCYA